MADSPPHRSALFDAFKKHWPGYLMEAMGLGLHHQNNKRCIFCEWRVAIAHRQEPLEPLWDSLVPAVLQVAVGRCLEKNRNARFVSAAELQQTLQQIRFVSRGAHRQLTA
jgi:hypothetical protein